MNPNPHKDQDQDQDHPSSSSTATPTSPRPAPAAATSSSSSPASTPSPVSANSPSRFSPRYRPRTRSDASSSRTATAASSSSPRSRTAASSSPRSRIAAAAAAAAAAASSSPRSPTAAAASSSSPRSPKAAAASSSSPRSRSPTAAAASTSSPRSPTAAAASSSSPRSRSPTAGAASSSRSRGRGQTSSSSPVASRPITMLEPPLGSVEFTKGINGLDKVVLRGPCRSSAEVYFYGAQVLSWKNKMGEELLFVSSKAVFNPPKPIRGGIPICFPQFWNKGPQERHGFVRNRFWRLDNNPPPIPTSAPCSSYIDLIIDEEDRWLWPQKYEFRQRVALGFDGELRLTARIRNIRRDGKPFTFSFAYHPYLFVSDIGEVRVEGVETMDYLDHLKDKERVTERGDAITFENEVDKVYLLTPTKIAVLDHQRRKTIEIRKDGLADAIVWNPWEKRSKTIEDFGNQDYKKTVCVGAAAIERPITLQPGHEWKGRMELTFVPSSYNSGGSSSD